MAIHRFRSCRCHRCSHSGNRFFGYIQSSSSSYSVYSHTRCYRPQHTIRTTAIRRIRFSLGIIHRSIFYRASQPFFCLQALLPGHGTLHTGIVTDDTGNVCLSHCIASVAVSAGINNLNFPSTSVAVPIDVPPKRTETPGIGSFFSSTTFPLTSRLATRVESTFTSLLFLFTPDHPDDQA